MTDYIIRNIEERVDLALYNDFRKAAKQLSGFCVRYNKDPGKYTIVKRVYRDGKYRYEPVVELE